jgi:hypothetical protein
LRLWGLGYLRNHHDPLVAEAFEGEQRSLQSAKETHSFTFSLSSPPTYGLSNLLSS